MPIRAARACPTRRAVAAEDVMIRTCSSGPGRSSSSHAARASTSFSQCLADLLFTAMILSFPVSDHISAPHRQNLEGGTPVGFLRALPV